MKTYREEMQSFKEEVLKTVREYLKTKTKLSADFSDVVLETTIIELIEKYEINMFDFVYDIEDIYDADIPDKRINEYLDIIDLACFINMYPARDDD